MWATARPWFPSVAATSVMPSRRGIMARSASKEAAGGTPARRLSARQTHEVPRTLNDGGPKRSVSRLTSRRERPSRSAAAGALARALGA